MFGARSWSDISLCDQMSAGQDGSKKGTWCLVGSSVTRETSRGARPSPPLISYCTIVSWGQGRVYRHLLLGRSVI